MTREQRPAPPAAPADEEAGCGARPAGSEQLPERSGRGERSGRPGWPDLSDPGAELLERLDASPTVKLVAMAGHMVSQRIGRIFGEQDGLSPSGAAVLGTFNRDIGLDGRITHAELARRCMITPATLTGVVNTLHKAGYLRRERDAEDRRVVWLRLTAEGAGRAQSLAAQRAEVTGPFRELIDPEDEVIVRAYLIRLLTRLASADQCPHGAHPAGPGAAEPKPGARAAPTDPPADSEPPASPGQRDISGISEMSGPSRTMNSGSSRSRRSA